MLTGKDVAIRLRNELNVWFKQKDAAFNDYYLYYMKSAPEHNGGLIFLKDNPSNLKYQLAPAEKVSKAKTVDQNFAYFHPIVSRLPILTVQPQPGGSQ